MTPTLPALQVTLIPINSLIPDEENAKIHTPEQVQEIAESIKEFGFNDPIGIRESTIVEGEGRWLAAKLLGMIEVPVIRLDHLTDDQRKAYALAHNHLNAKTGLNPVKVKVTLTALKVANFNLKPIGFTPLEIKKFLADPKKTENEDAADDAIAEAEAAGFVPFVKTGDLWLLGEHRLFCGDSLKKEDVTRTMCGRTVDLVLTDPPYNVAYVGKTADAMTIDNDKMGDKAFRDFLFEAYSRMYEVTKPGGSIYVFHADSEGYNFRGAMIDAGWDLKQCLIWVKNSMVMGRQDYHWRHEPILKGWKPGAAHTWNADRKQTTILEFNRPTKSPDHPTPKPVDMLVYLIKNSSLEEEVVFDPFGGSGSTLIASEQCGRICHTMELSPKYASVIVRRWADLTGKQPTCERGDQVLTLAEAKAAR